MSDPQSPFREPPPPDEIIHVLVIDPSNDERDTAMRDLQRIVASRLGIAMEENGEIIIAIPPTR